MPPEWHPLGRGLIILGATLVGFGLALVVAPKLPWLGRLPGDLLIQRERFWFSFPLASCLLASLLISLLLWLVGRFR